MERNKKVDEFVRYNEKMNSRLINDWDREMILDAIEMYHKEQLKELTTNRQ